MGALQPWHIILIVVVALLLFGGKKLPDAARGLGRSLRIFKSEVSAMQDDKKATATGETDATAAIATPVSQIVPASVVVPPAPVVVPPAAAVVPPPAVAVPQMQPSGRTTINGVPVDEQRAS